MTPTDVDHFYREVARVALTVAREHGFVLGGGVAWVINGLVQRPTEDIDLFTDTDGGAAAAADAVRAALESAGFEVEDEEDANELGELFYGFDLDQREFIVGNGERTVKLSLCRLDRHHSPVVMDVAVRSVTTSTSRPRCGATRSTNCSNLPAGRTPASNRTTSWRPAASSTASMTPGSPTTASPPTR